MDFVHSKISVPNINCSFYNIDFGIRKDLFYEPYLKIRYKLCKKVYTLNGKSCDY